MTCAGRSVANGPKEEPPAWDGGLFLGDELRDERRDAAVVTQTQPETHEAGAKGPTKRTGRRRLGGAAQSGHACCGELVPQFGGQLENGRAPSLTYHGTGRRESASVDRPSA